MALLLNLPLTSVIAARTASNYDGVSQVHSASVARNVTPGGETTPVPGRLEITTGPDGSPALLSRIAPGDAEPFGPGSGIRAELSFPDRANGEIWYAWDVWHEAGFSSAEVITFMQVHDTPDGGESPVKYPNFEFQTQGGYVHATVTLNAPSEATANGRYPQQRRVPLVTGRWVRCALHTNWGTDSSGFLECWYDGQLVAREWSRACGYTDAVGPYLKLGLYDFTHGGISQPLTAWFRNCKVYSSGHGPFEVLGVAPTQPPLTQMMRAR